MPIVAQLPDLSGCHLQEKDTTMIMCERDNPNVEIDVNSDYQGSSRRGKENRSSIARNLSKEILHLREPIYTILYTRLAIKNEARPKKSKPAVTL